MTKLTWSNDTQKKYESGVDRGVFYPSDGPGVVWNGLISVDESSDGGNVQSYYYDAVKYLDVLEQKNFQAKITSFSTPKGFSSVIGELSILPGFILTRQPKARFDFTYRSMVGESNYRLHLVYNALASRNGRSYSSLSDAPKAETRELQIDAIPPSTSGPYRPTAHIAIDTVSTQAAPIARLEQILYGDLTHDPRMPSVDEIYEILTLWDPYLITPNALTGLSTITESSTGDLTPTKVSGLFRATSSTRLVSTATDGLYTLEV